MDRSYAYVIELAEDGSYWAYCPIYLAARHAPRRRGESSVNCEKP